MHKSKFLALLLAVAMVVSMVVVPAYATAEGDTSTLTPEKSVVSSGEEPAPTYDPTQVLCPCETCNNKVPAGGWQVWDGTQVTGHYYLTGDVTLAAAVEFNGLVLNLNSNDVICGATTDAKATGRTGKRFYVQSGAYNLDILDATAHYEGSTYVAGAIRGGAASGGANQTKRGGNICNYGTGTVTIHSGKVTGGSAERGGNIYTNNGELKIKGGEISGGNSTGGTYGYQVMAYQTDLYISGGHVKSNTAKPAITVMETATDGSGVTVITGGIIENTGAGTAITFGGSGTGKGTTASMYGGEIRGTATVAYVSTLHIYGGTITGNITRSSNSTKVPVLYNGEFGTLPPNEWLAEGCSCVVENDTGSYNVWHYADHDTCAFKTAKTTHDITVLEGEHNSPIQDGNPLTGWACGHCGTPMSVSNVEYRTCAHHGPEQAYLPWNGENVSGHYYLTGDVDLNDVVVIPDTEGVCIDLAGYTITAPENERAFYNSGTLTIVDSGADGKILGNGTYNGNGGVIYTVGTLNLVDGTVADGNVGDGVEDTAVCSGGNIYVAAGTFNMYADAVVRDGTADKYAGNIYLNGSTTEIQGGTITNGTASQYGGNLYATSGASVRISNATVTYGKSNGGGNIIFNNDVTAFVNSCVIYGGVSTVATTASEIYLGGDSTLTIQGASVIGVDPNKTEDCDTDSPLISERSASCVINIKAGVTLSEMPAKAEFFDAKMLAYNGTAYQTADTFTAAEAYAGINGTIKLYDAVTVDSDLALSVAELDLNGKTLTVKGSLAASSTNIVDASGDASITVEGENVATSRTNEYLPVSVDGAVKLLKPTNYNKGSQNNAGNTTKMFAFYLNGAAAQDIVNAINAEQAKDKVTLSIRLLKGNEDVGTYVVPTEILEQYAVEDWANKVIMVTATGAEADAEYSIEVICASASGTIYTTAYAED